jgi:hypothetical protein
MSTAPRRQDKIRQSCQNIVQASMLGRLIRAISANFRQKLAFFLETNVLIFFDIKQQDFK